jgi:hypothetical protein
MRELYSVAAAGRGRTEDEERAAAVDRAEVVVVLREQVLLA